MLIELLENLINRLYSRFNFLAPAFDGRKEIWDALRGACYAIEQNDIDLAQSSKNFQFKIFLLLFVRCFHSHPLC